MAGMLELLITDVAADEIAKALGPDAVALPLPGAPKLTVVPVTDALSMVTDFSEVIDGFELLTGGVVRRALQMSTTGRVLYLHVEFFGGLGFHAVLGWRHGEPELHPLFTANHETALQHDGYALIPEDDLTEMAVNVGLRFLGVDKGEAGDEFAAVGLDRYDWTAEWAAAAEPIRF